MANTPDGSSSDQMRNTEPQTPENGPLAGLRVVDLGRVVAGPLAAMILGDLGADVIKVEPAPDGDFIRHVEPSFTPGMGSYFATVNRNKRSVLADLRKPGGKKLLAALIGEADVVVENFRPGVMEAMGFDPAELVAQHPRLIVARQSAYGATGPDARKPGVDQIIQGVSGFMSVTGTLESGPTRAGIAISDVLCALCGAIAIQGALAERERTGRGQVVTGSLLESMLGLMSVQAGKYFATGAAPAPEGNHHPVVSPYGLFPTSDGHVQLQVMHDRNFRELVRVLDKPEWLDDTRFNSTAARSSHRDAMREAVTEATLGWSTDDLLIELEAADIPSGPVLDLAEAYEMDQSKARDMVQQMVLGDGAPLRLPGFPFKLEKGPHLRRPPPLPGEHTEEVLAELGLTEDEEIVEAVSPRPRSAP
ncbi:MAG: CoA transferase [Pseudomonadota bacterium]